MRVAVVQFAPQIGRVQENVETARRLCRKLTPRSVDLVCFPEMIFTGYVFPNAEAIAPHLEECGKGPTSQFCSSLAARLQCYVTAGYPERLAPQEPEERALDDGTTVTTVGANSAVLYGPDGSLIGTYRKTNLYETDMTWAKAGTGFVTFKLPPPLGTVSLAICMDLNVKPPSMWSLSEGPYEIADYCKLQQTNLLILLNAWLDSGDGCDRDADWSTMNYWTSRLRPLWAKPHNSAGSLHVQDEPLDTIVLICNRCGEENGITFAGSSSVFSMSHGSGAPRLLDFMGRQEENVAVWTIPSREKVR